ncbi:hypothetical protein D3C78_1172260 [compost metagenome]
MPATAQTICQMRLRLMPMDSAARVSSATARSDTPIRVLLNSSASTVTSTAAVAAATRSNWLTITSPMNSGTSSMPRSSARTWAPIRPWARPSMMNDRPRVAMNRVICERLTSGRSTVRSMTMAPMAITTTVSSSARAKGSPCSCRLTKVSAANSSMAPWAKLNTPLAL